MQDDKSAGESKMPASDETSSCASPAGGTRRISSDELFAGAREIGIDHNGRRYQLRITQTGKLILTA
jgi:hemin uptake protein HemP